MPRSRPPTLPLVPPPPAVLGAERFVQEIKTTAGLQYPHILPLFDPGTADGHLCYVMPYIHGEVRAIIPGSRRK